MQLERWLSDARVRVAALIGTCFLLGSTGWLAWLRRIMALTEPAQVDFYTMVLGYLVQALGIGLFMIVCRRISAQGRARSTIAALIMYVVLLEPATMTENLAITLTCGYVMNIFCGYVMGHYLTCLAELVPAKGRGISFGTGYAASTVVNWLLSLGASDLLSGNVANLIVCMLLTVLAILAVRGAASLEPAKAEPNGSSYAPWKMSTLVTAACAVVLMSAVNTIGFSFPTADLSGVVNLELSRLLYGTGLVIAGVLADRDRRYALACCTASLAVPFLMLALSSAGASSVFLWALGYLLFGFLAVFRVTLFTDLSERNGMLWFAGAGLLFGRLGDSLGTSLNLTLADSPLVHITVAAILFVVTVMLLFALYQRLFAHVATPAKPLVRDEREILATFCAAHNLSAREREVLPLLIEGKTNAEIAGALFISESTVKFHVRNILKKTSCSTRLEAIDLYARESR